MPINHTYKRKKLMSSKILFIFNRKRKRKNQHFKYLFSSKTQNESHLGGLSLGVGGPPVQNLWWPRPSRRYQDWWGRPLCEVWRDREVLVGWPMYELLRDRTACSTDFSMTALYPGFMTCGGRGERIYQSTNTCKIHLIL